MYRLIMMIPAILTTVLFATSAASAARSTRLLGSNVANFLRLSLATVFLASWAHAFGLGLGGGALVWFFLSGVVGFGLGDIALYAAYPRIGARLGVLLCMCLAAPIAGFVEWVWLGTRPSTEKALWSAMILVGVVIALAPEPGELPESRGRWVGILCGLGAALGQGCGAVLSRKAYQVAQQAGFFVDGGTAAYQRIVGGIAVMLLFVLMQQAMHRHRGTSVAVPSRLVFRQAWPWVLINSLSGPTIGVACFQWALAVAPTGIVLAVVATTPLAVIPLSVILDGERPHRKSLIGGVIAVCGAVGLSI